MSHTYAKLPVSSRTFYEIRKALIDAGHPYPTVCFVDADTIDMNGLALTLKPTEPYNEPE